MSPRQTVKGIQSFIETSGLIDIRAYLVFLTVGEHRLTCEEIAQYLGMPTNRVYVFLCAMADRNLTEIVPHVPGPVYRLDVPGLSLFASLIRDMEGEEERVS